MKFRGCAATVITHKVGQSQKTSNPKILSGEHSRTIEGPYPSRNMSHAENLLTVEGFTRKGWPETPHSRRVEEIISVHNETNRFTDRFTYFYDEEGFYMWAKGKDDDIPKKVHIGEIIDSRSYPGTAEGEVFDKLDNWFTKNSEGWALWVSPSYPGKYPSSKIILHQIAYTFGDMQKLLQNSADLFNAPDEAILGILHEFFPQTRSIDSLETMRPLLITPDDNFDPPKLLDKIREIDPNALAVNGRLDPTQLVERATYISDLIDSGANPGFVAYEMQRLDLIGQHAISCAGGGKTFSELITDGLGTKDRHGSLQFECPSCHKTNSRPFGMLISNCQNCGANVRCD